MSWELICLLIYFAGIIAMLESWTKHWLELRSDDPDLDFELEQERKRECRSGLWLLFMLPFWPIWLPPMLVWIAVEKIIERRKR